MTLCDGPFVSPRDLDVSECGRLLLSSIVNSVIVLCIGTYESWRRWHPEQKLRLLPAPWVGQQDLIQDAKSEGNEPVLVEPLAVRNRRFLVTIAIIAAVLQSLVALIAASHRIGVLEWLSPAICAFAWSFIGLRLAQRVLRTPPFDLLLLQITLLFDQVFALRHDRGSLSLLRLLSVAASLTLLLMLARLPLQQSRPSDRVATPGDAPTSGFSSPEDGLSCLQFLTVSWISPLLRLAAQRQLNFEDLWARSPYNETKNLLPRFQTLSEGNLLWRLLRINARDVGTEISARLASVLLSFLGPFLLNRILDAFAHEAVEPGQRSLVYTLAGAALLADLIRAQFDLLAGWAARRVYERSRQTLVANAHAKALRRQNIIASPVDEKDENAVDHATSDIGRILNIAQNDTWRISQLMWDSISSSLLAPLEIIVACTLLYSFLGWSAFAGVGVFVVAALIQIPLGRLTYKVDRRTQRASDKRIGIVSEILHSIRLLKQLSWEQPWLQKAEDARRVELRQRLIGNVIDIFTSLLWSLVPGLMPLAAFYCLIKIEKRPLTVPIAFPSLALLDMVRFPLQNLPEAVFRFIRVLISCRRVQHFYEEPDVPPVPIRTVGKDVPTPAGLVFEASTFCYPMSSTGQDRPRFQLKVPALTFQKASLHLVCGPTGSGKSSLFNALLGEMEVHGGGVFKIGDIGPHSIGLAGQQPWLEQATIRDNICLTNPYDAQRFQQTVRACALEPDLRELSHGDLTEIGERGVSLSGGQQARIALARAVYSDAEFVLLDDPLSAVDVESARHIYQHCIRGPLLADRCVIMTTHAERLCRPAATRILRLVEGLVTVEERLVDVEEPISEESLPEVKTIEQLLGQALPPGAEPHKLVDEEFRETGAVRWSVYRLFLRSSGFSLWVLVSFCLLGEQGIDVAQRYLLKVWSEGGVRSHRGPFASYPQPDVDANPWLLAYLSIFLVGRILLTSRNALAIVGSYRAAKVLFLTCLENVMRARMRWFDTTPVGRITNRLTGDVAIADSELSFALRSFLATLLSFIAAFVVVIWLVPAFAPAALLIFWAYWRLARGYRCAFRDIRRLERVAWSPMFSTFGNTLDGLLHIRAFGLQKHYQDQMNKICDIAENADRLKWIVIFWLRLRFDALSALAVFFVTILAFASDVDQGFAAFGILSARTFVNAIHEIIWLLSLDVENLDGDESTPKLPSDWPSSSGAGITYNNLVFTYAPGLHPALDGISLRIGPREKVGIVGRTGSGKSSLVNSLLRFCEPAAGSISIDGVDVTSLSLKTLRSHITSVPQRATLFAGSLRQNLDPLHLHNDADLCDLLHRVQLSHWSLDDVIDASGSGTSAGERQLIALARAFLRKSRIVILDESTANIDIDMDRKLQHIIREELSDCLVLTIAHRLETIIDYDRIVVLAKGRVVEEGSPADLIDRPNSAFRTLCQRSGAFDALQRAAR